jgi:hypothetical protein
VIFRQGICVACNCRAIATRLHARSSLLGHERFHEYETSVPKRPLARSGGSGFL